MPGEAILRPGRRIAALAVGLCFLLSMFTAYAGETKTISRVNLRTGASLDAAVIKTLEAGVTVEVDEQNTEGWSKVKAGGAEGYIKSEYLGAAPSVYITNSRVNLRVSASLDAAIIQTLENGVTVDVISYDAAAWSKVKAGGKEGYVKSEYLAEKTAGKAAAADENAYRTTSRVNFRASAALDAPVIKMLSLGAPVYMVEYNAEGWSKVKAGEDEGYIKSEYLVKSEAFTGPVSENGVELISWPEAKNIVRLNTPITVYDVRSGAVYIVQSFSNGSHADVEPLTKTDTEIMHKTFGNKWSWDVRPVWVTIGGHTMAASINGMPHGGGVIADNGMNGQICLHFLGSAVHNGNKSFQKTHQNVVMEAWNAR